MLAHFSLRTQMKVSPQMVLTGQMLEGSNGELEELIQKALVQYPALQRIPARHPAGNRSEWLEGVSYRPTVLEMLLEQARLLDPQGNLELIEDLLARLDEHGYLRAAPGELAAELGASARWIEAGLAVLHQLDPAGIGARDLRECLLIQIQRLQEDGRVCPVAERLLSEGWDAFSRQQWARAARWLKVSLEDVQAAVGWVARNLTPYPLNLPVFQDEPSVSRVVPDLLFVSAPVAAQSPASSMDGTVPFYLVIPAEQAFRLCVRPGYLDRSSEVDPGDRAWFIHQTTEARLFITALEQRWSTLRRIGETLIELHGDFLQWGDSRLRPLTRMEVAERLGLHESTVSRAVSGKWARLPDGRLVELSMFFNQNLRERDTIARMIAQEQYALSDQEISERLKAAGYPVARRTVAKYRRQMRLDSSRQRARQSSRF